MTEYWLISAPADKTCQQTYETLNNLTSKQNSLSVNYKFHIPDLKVGTLDQLVGLSDDLGKLDAFVEQVTRKVATYLGEVLEDQRDKLHENLLANNSQTSVDGEGSSPDGGSDTPPNTPVTPSYKNSREHREHLQRKLEKKSDAEPAASLGQHHHYSRQKNHKCHFHHCQSRQHYCHNHHQKHRHQRHHYHHYHEKVRKNSPDGAKQSSSSSSSALSSTSSSPSRSPTLSLFPSSASSSSSSSSVAAASSASSSPSKQLLPSSFHSASFSCPSSSTQKRQKQWSTHGEQTRDSNDSAHSCYHVNWCVSSSLSTPFGSSAPSDAGDASQSGHNPTVSSSNGRECRESHIGIGRCHRLVAAVASATLKNKHSIKTCQRRECKAASKCRSMGGEKSCSFKDEEGVRRKEWDNHNFDDGDDDDITDVDDDDPDEEIDQDNGALPNPGDLPSYITRFQWDMAKYPIKQSLRNIADIISKQVGQIDADLKTKSTTYNNLKGSLQNLEKKQTGSLLTRNLADLVKKEHFILDSEYLSTLLVIVPKTSFNDWFSVYEKLTDMIVPRSSQLITQDPEYGLFTVTLFKKVIEEFKLHAREKKFIVRDFIYNEEELAAGKNEITKLVTDKKKQFGPLVRWLKVNFSECFCAWIHVKALRIFVESVLRYGLPVNFQAILLHPHKKCARRLRDVLNQLYAHLDSSTAPGGQSGNQDSVDIPGLGFGQSDYYPYVYYKINVDMIDNKV
ncbi:V-type proton ATPase subunit C [Prorops nasuta]|uniref:V-type proton ATPase subunit C n=1 Tax=Prorops nasuta TaxID=863751 RepID=UPI0034CFAA22